MRGGTNGLTMNRRDRKQRSQETGLGGGHGCWARRHYRRSRLSAEQARLGQLRRAVLGGLGAPRLPKWRWEQQAECPVQETEI